MVKMISNVIKVNSKQELENQTTQYMMMKYKLVQSTNNYRILREKAHGNIGIHIILYILGWIFYAFCSYLSYSSYLASQSGLYYYDYYDVYYPNPLLYVILILALIGTLNIIYYYYSKKHAKEVKIELTQQQANKTNTNNNKNIKTTTSKSNSIKSTVKPSFCPNCGAEIESTDSFCRNCGTTIPKKN